MTGPTRQAREPLRSSSQRTGDPLDELLLAQSFEIWTRRFDGRLRFYQAYRDEKIAEGVAVRLRELGQPCELRTVRATLRGRR